MVFSIKDSALGRGGNDYMEKITAVNGLLLKWAREVSNMPIPFVAEKFSKNPDTIIAWEGGSDYPTYSQLEKLGGLYKKPLAIFFFPSIPQGYNIKSSCRTLPESTFNSLSYKVIRKMNDARVMQLNLYELNEGKNPSKQLLTNMNFSNNANQTATQLRRLLGVSLVDQKRIRKVNEALEMWRNKLIDLGIYVFKDAFEDDSISGFCLYDKEFPVIYINNSMSFTRQIFTLFHELYHLISNTSGIDKIKDDYFEGLSTHKLMVEKTCNAFAGEFLVPDVDFDIQVSHLKLTELTTGKLANEYNVSREVIMRKLLDRRLISQDEYDQKHEQFKIEAIRARQKKKDENGGGNFFNTKIAYLGHTYLYQAFEKYSKNKIDIYQLSEYTRTKIGHLPKLSSKLGLED